MKLVKADFTTLKAGDFVVTWRPEGMELTEGEVVMAYDPDDGLCASATVARVTELTDLLYLRVDWGTQIHYLSEEKA